MAVIPVRVTLWIMLFTCCWVTYMLRVGMSITIIGMVPPVSRNASAGGSPCGSQSSMKHVSGDVVHYPGEADGHPLEEEEKKYGKVYDWSVAQQGLILGTYFWTYPISSLIGGMAAERYGPRLLVFVVTLISAFVTALSPMAADLGYYTLVIIRLILGLAAGFIYPCLHCLVARWVPQAEKGKFIAALMGGTLGTVVTWSLTGLIMENHGWSAAFYVPAAIAAAWCFIWWYLVADSPNEHKMISEKEKTYILTALGDRVQTKSKSMPPFKKIATSLPFLAMTVLHYGNLWGLYFILTAGPMFVKNVLGFQLSAAGALSALPYLARLFFAPIFGSIGDYLLGKQIWSTTKIRKFFCIFSHIIPGLLLGCLVSAGCNWPVSISLITFSMGMNGAATLTNLQNHQDLAPNYAGTLYGVANAIGSTAGFFTPMITAYFTKTGNTFDNWGPVFYVGAGAYIGAALFFIIFGTGNIQKWNYRQEPEPAGVLSWRPWGKTETPPASGKSSKK
ncbi:sialin [Helicoverpa armigera]|uniref:Major facilitator superfamily (MFS) profile domain-containing protein n=1 Tax=Helicoverpa armigera TaxID=29058 RepID=A0A2W1BAQ1_HELAM|nr:sialin [Helicoverpa armigera]PZC71004.1 hypothetical protein B5X24_HaOG214448 [Helicoverpa armigera]